MKYNKILIITGLIIAVYFLFVKRNLKKAKEQASAKVETAILSSASTPPEKAMARKRNQVNNSMSLSKDTSINKMTGSSTSGNLRMQFDDRIDALNVQKIIL